ncbi:MAG: SDR family NAD(P)-dependent oxidoreductase [Polyangiaceae bacterium]
MNVRGRWVLVTGASSGLGLEIAKGLAKNHGANLVLAARRRERLDALKSEIESAHQVRVEVVTSDLAKPGEAARLYEQTIEGRDIYGAVLNAGVTHFGRATEQDDANFEALLATNVTSLVELSTRFARYLIGRREGGGIMLVSSLAGFNPMPYQATYGASKAFVTSFGRALNEEIRENGVSVTVFAPGGIATEMLSNTPGIAKQYKQGDVGIMDADECAASAIDGFLKRKDVQVPGALNRAIALATKVAPHGIVASQIARLYEKGLDK